MSHSLPDWAGSKRSMIVLTNQTDPTWTMHKAEVLLRFPPGLQVKKVCICVHSKMNCIAHYKKSPRLNFFVRRVSQIFLIRFIQLPPVVILGDAIVELSWMSLLATLQFDWLPETDDVTESQSADWLLMYTTNLALVAAMNRKVSYEPCVALGALWNPLDLDETAGRLEAAFKEVEGYPNVNWAQVTERYWGVQSLWLPCIEEDVIAGDDGSGVEEIHPRPRKAKAATRKRGVAETTDSLPGEAPAKVPKSKETAPVRPAPSRASGSGTAAQVEPPATSSAPKHTLGKRLGLGLPGQRKKP